MGIYTLTLNPAFDIHCIADGFTVGRENHVSITGREAGGKGINVSRALASFGKESIACIVLGHENGDELLRLLEPAQLNIRSVSVDGRIRENLTVHDKDSSETRISFAGITADGSLLELVERELLFDICDGDFLTFTGSIPDGIKRSDVVRFFRRVGSRGVRIVIDSRSLILDDIVEISPFLIKPNEQELASYLGCDPGSQEAVVRFATRLNSLGIENVAVSLGGRGAILACADGIYHALPPHIDVRSTIGAGDSMIAGFLTGVCDGCDIADALRLAVAFGTAACLTAGTEPPRGCDVDRIYPTVKVNRIDPHT